MIETMEEGRGWKGNWLDSLSIHDRSYPESALTPGFLLGVNLMNKS
jgi:hypothetical protein